MAFEDTSGSGYRLEEVASLLEISPRKVLGFVRQGFVEPERESRGALRFTFRDLVLLRTAKELSKSVSQKRVRRSLDQLKEQLPANKTLTGLKITAQGGEVIVSDSGTSWQPESGQIMMNFDHVNSDENVTHLDPKHAQKSAVPPMTAITWYELGCGLQGDEPVQARDAFRRSLELNPTHIDSRLSLGLLLEDVDNLESALVHYSLARNIDPSDPVPAFRLGKVLQRLDRNEEALEAYAAAINADPTYADAYYSASQLCSNMERNQEADQYLDWYRNVTENKS